MSVFIGSSYTWCKGGLPMNALWRTIWTDHINIYVLLVRNITKAYKKDYIIRNLRKEKKKKRKRIWPVHGYDCIWSNFVIHLSAAPSCHLITTSRFPVHPSPSPPPSKKKKTLRSWAWAMKALPLNLKMTNESRLQYLPKSQWVETIRLCLGRWKWL